jgi:hypothetical protein
VKISGEKFYFIFFRVVRGKKYYSFKTQKERGAG